MSRPSVLADPLVERDLDDLALAAGASSRTVTRLFPDETGLTFREWRRRARIMAAAEMLSSGSRPVKDVSSRFGFSSTAAFGHAFREVMGHDARRVSKTGWLHLDPRAAFERALDLNVASGPKIRQERN